MAGQEQEHRTGARREREDAEPAPEAVSATPVKRSAEQDAELDSLLDEIDGVLETNAEEFVQNFVQKGGQ